MICSRLVLVANHLASGDKLRIRAAGKTLALLAVYVMAAFLAWAVYSSYRAANVRTIAVFKLSDLEEAFEVRGSSLRVKNPAFLRVCLVGDYVYVLKDVKDWFAGHDAEFVAALRAAGGPGDIFNGAGNSAIVLLAHRSALILQLDLRTDFSAANLGCANADSGIEIKRYQTNSSTEFYLPNATLRAPTGAGQPQVTLCAEKFHRFQESIDELLANNEAPGELFWAVIRKYLPASGCRVDEVMAISKTSRFFAPPGDGYDFYRIAFTNSDTTISFSLNKDTGNIAYPDVRSTKTSF